MKVRNWIAYCLVVVCLFVGGGAHSDNVVASDIIVPAKQEVPITLDGLKQMLAAIQYLQTEFVQERNLSVLSKPLISTGTMFYQKNNGICWQLSKPVPATVYLSKLQVTMMDSSGEMKAKTSNPVLKLFSDLFFAVFSGDFTELKNQFDIEWLSKGSQWSISLLPKNSMVSQVADRFEIQGNHVVTNVNLIQKNGDSTVLRFVDSSFELSRQAGSLKCERGDV